MFYISWLLLVISGDYSSGTGEGPLVVEETPHDGLLLQPIILQYFFRVK